MAAEYQRNTGNIVRLCCLTWPRQRPEVPAFYEWGPPMCCGRIAGSIFLGAGILPWAVLKGVLVAVPAAMFGFVGGVLLIPTSLARTTICLTFRMVTSRTMSWKKRMLCLPIVVAMVIAWAPLSVVMLAIVTVLASVFGVLLAFNATYIAAFYKAVNDMDDPMDFWIPQSVFGRAMFGILETFEHMVNMAELYMLGYLDYLEPKILHWADPESCEKPVKQVAQPKMIIATRGTQEGKGDRRLSSRVTVDHAFVAATTSNILFNDDLSADLDYSFDEPLSQQMRSINDVVTRSSQPGKADAASNNPLAMGHPSANAPALSEWNLIRSETERQAQAFDHRTNECAVSGEVKISVDVDARNATTSQAGAPGSWMGVGQQRGYGEWGISRSKTFGPCDARFGTVVRSPMTAQSAADEFPPPAPRTDGFSNECACTAQIRPGDLVVTLLHEMQNPKDLTDKTMKLWRFCPNLACINSRPNGSDLPLVPDVLPIDRFARVTIFEQLQLEKAGIGFRCT